MRSIVLALLVACSTEPAPDGDDTGVGPVDDSGDTDTDPTGFDESVATATGEITWAIDFEAEAEAGGFTDCTYTRTYELVEDRSQAWLCPECDVMLRGDAEVTDGHEDCYAQISSAEAVDVEWLGWADGVFYRAKGENFRLTEQGTASVSAGGVQTHNPVEDVALSAGGTFDFDITGDLALGTTEADPLHGHRAPASYACGWPKADPAAYTGDYRVTVGGTLPDAVLSDACGEDVRLHDLAGRYLIVDVAAVNCPPCRQMAADAPDFFAEMDDLGLDVEAVTLLAPALNDTLTTASVDILQDWIDTFGAHGPVLADRGYGVWVIGEAAGDDFGYPTTLVVSPDLEVLSLRVGYGSAEGWAPFGDAIRAHAGL